MTSFKDKLLKHFNLTDEEYKYLSHPLNEVNLPDYRNFEGILELTDTIKNIIKEKKKVLIYGDYDCDGIMSTCIIVKTFEKLGHKVSYYIPKRDTDGYGLNIKNIDHFASMGYEVIIMVDNGITLNKEVDYANSLGIMTIIIDHHTPLETLPNAKHIMHYKTSNFGEINMSAGATCYYLSEALLGKSDPYLLILATISIISDVMPLISYNRDLVRLGIDAINTIKEPHIYLLFGNNKDLNEKDISFTIVPKINAVLRLITTNNLYYVPMFFLEDDFIKMNKYANYIQKIYLNKKELIEEVLPKLTYETDKPYIFTSIDENEGLIGEVANRILSNTNKPTMCAILIDGNRYKASLRSSKNFSCIDFLSINSELFNRFGGHFNAAGCEFNKENLGKILSKMEEFSLSNKEDSSKKEKYIEINFNEFNLENYMLFESFRPFGHDFEEPFFTIKHFRTSEFVYSFDHKHILTPTSMNSKIVYFNYDSAILKSDYVDLIGCFEKNVFRDKISTQLNVKKFINY